MFWFIFRNLDTTWNVEKCYFSLTWFKRSMFFDLFALDWLNFDQGTDRGDVMFRKMIVNLCGFGQWWICSAWSLWQSVWHLIQWKIFIFQSALICHLSFWNCGKTGKMYLCFQGLKMISFPHRLIKNFRQVGKKKRELIVLLLCGAYCLQSNEMLN